MNKRTVLILLGLVVLVGGWYLFRPERLFVNQQVSEALPTAPASGAAAGPKTLAAGSFHGVAHETQGTAAILELAGGQRVLRLTGFQTSNGPDVQVYLVAAPDATDNDTVTKAGFVHVGALKGNIGDQNYELAANVDLNKFQSVTIWCRRFGVNFGTAPLVRQ